MNTSVLPALYSGKTLEASKNTRRNDYAGIKGHYTGEYCDC